MSMAFYFVNEGFTPERYDEAIKQLDAAGAGAPPGRLHHTAFETDGQIQVFDIWESEEAMGAFGETLMPILHGLGVEVAPPMVSPVHNVIEGKPANA